jgi:acylphosphatase
MERQTVHFRGHVQGVGFRATVRSLARNYAVQGYVKNLPDGRVELVMEGDPAEMTRLVAAVRERMSGYIRDVTTATSPATGEFEGFEIC